MRTWFNVAFGEGVVEKDRGIEEQAALNGAGATTGRLASDGMRYLMGNTCICPQLFLPVGYARTDVLDL